MSQETGGTGTSRRGSGSGGADRRLRTRGDLDALDFAKQGGLLPVVVQDADAGDVLMVAWADREALEATLETGEMHFRSRSRDELWRKGETSGNVQRVRSLHADCDADTVLALVESSGPACHTGDRTCFGVEGVGAGEPTETDEVAGEPTAAAPSVLDELWEVLERRSRERPDGSYTVRLLDDENLRLKKLGEETAELVATLARGEAGRAPEEAADLLYHVLVSLLGAGASLQDVIAELEARRG